MYISTHKPNKLREAFLSYRQLLLPHPYPELIYTASKPDPEPAQTILIKIKAAQIPYQLVFADNKRYKKKSIRGNY